MACTCDHNKLLLIEVTGTQHDTQQDFAFYDLTDMKQQFALEGKKYTDKALSETTIYGWDWCQEKENRNVWLSVKASDGPIMLPLFDNVSHTQRIAKGPQKYQLHSFIPLTLLPTFKEHATTEERIAPLRDGYLYIAYNGKIWREIEVSATDAGEPCFKDVNLFAYRQGRDKPVKTETKREVTGEALKEIWYPAKENGRKTDIRMAYSEVQWSGARINNLEANPSELNVRMERIDDLNRASDMLEMRARDDVSELQLADPCAFNKDLSGAVLQTRLQSAQKEREEYCKDDAFTTYSEMNYEYDARSSVLGRVLWQKQKDAKVEKLGPEPDFSSWEGEATGDYLADAKARKLQVLYLTDPVFNLRHHLAILQYANSFLQQIQLDAMSQPFYKSAELLQIFVLTPKLGEQENPSYKLKKHVDLKDHSPFKRTLRFHWREKIRDDVRSLQKKVLERLKDHKYAFALKDMISMGNGNALGALIQVNTCRHALLSDPDQCDQLLPKHKRRDFSSSLASVNEIFVEDSSHPLREVLFGSKKTQETLKKYLDTVEETAPYKKELEKLEGEANDGSGIINVALLAKIVSQGLEMKPESLEQVEAGTLIRISQDAEQSEFPQVRRIMGAIDAMLSSYFQHGLDLTTLAGALAETKQATISMPFKKLYTDAVGMAKMFGGDTLKSLTFVPVTGEKIEGFVIGLDNPDAKFGVGPEQSSGSYRNTQGRQIAHGDLSVDGEKIASTSKARMPKNTSLDIQEDLQLLMLKDVDSEAAQFIKKNHQLIDELKTADLSKDHVTKTNAYEKFHIPLFVLGIELMNCWNALNYFYKHKENDSVYSIFSAISAAFDISIASVHSRNLMKANTGRLFALSDKTALQLSAETQAAWPKGKLGIELVGRVTALELVGCAAGLLTAGLMVWDMIRLFGRRDNDAAWGTALMATGVVFGSVAGLFFSSTWTFLGMGPIGWISLIVVGAGFLITYLFTDGPLEAWIKNGPFGEDPASGDDDYAFLTQQPEEAYKQLLNLFVSLRIQVDPIEAAPFSATQRHAYKTTGITHCVRIKSNVAQLFNVQDNKIQFKVKFRQVLERVSENRGEIEARENMKRTFGDETAARFRSPMWQVIKHQPIQEAETIVNAEERIYLFKNTYAAQESVVSPQAITRYQRNIQVLAQVEVKNMVFPQPPLAEFKETQRHLADGKISIKVADFDDGQPVGFWETLMNEPKSHPVNYFWADSRERDYQFTATDKQTDSQSQPETPATPQAQLQQG
ncbi:hypothetical protein RND59_07135 [Vibrio ruber]|uniref:toxin VasX n=1 Tax=Vibrio ruber TaxID=184755 RepID=UPI0028933237|nr:toxin VasX [Vibrio ruber]WNJ96841.1 hypothetical protein RND59_07135 [Vibrio ruber]